MEQLEQIGFGGIKSPYDYRKLQYADLVGEAQPLPPSFFVDISQLPVWMQRQIGCCTNCSTDKKKQQSDFIQSGVIPGLSYRFTYALCKANDGIPNDQGTYYDMPFKMLSKYGVCTEDFLPNDTTLPYVNFIDTTKISLAAYADGATRLINGYAEVDVTNLTLLKQAIANSQGVVLGVEVGSEWYTGTNGIESWAAADILPLRPPAITISGHAVYCYGWQDMPNGDTQLWILNSWSDQWAIKGTGYLMYNEYKSFIQEAVTMADVPDLWIQHLKAMPPANQFNHNFETNLAYGQTSQEVMNLQIALKIDGEFSSTLAETQYYGDITAKAVLAFQLKYGVAETIELDQLEGKSVGPVTRAALNRLYSK